MNVSTLSEKIRTVHDFPKKGIAFKDLTTLFINPEYTDVLIQDMLDHYEDKRIDKVVCIESRGFFLGGLLAHKLRAGFVPLRKKGKLPFETYEKSYQLEYGADTIEIHKDAIEPGETVLLHDDLLATGGTASAAISLIRDNFDVKVVYSSFIVELSFLEGRKRIEGLSDIYSQIVY